MPENFDYRRYLASRDWAVRKRQVRDRSGGLCERCLTHVMSVVHHLTYEHIGDEFLEELQGICRPCHDFLSAVTDDDPTERVLTPGGWAHLAQHITLEALGRALDHAMKVWGEDLSDDEVEEVRRDWCRIDPEQFAELVVSATVRRAP